MKTRICPRYFKNAGFAAMLMLLSPAVVFAQVEPAGGISGISEQDLLLGLIVFLAIALILSVIGLLFAVKALMRIMAGEELFRPASATAQAKGEAAESQDFWANLKYKLSGAVPVEREHEVMTDHEYDGIIELDNSLPPWWKAMFYATIVFSVIYLGTYHVFGWGQLQDQEYETELAEAKQQIEAYMASKGGAINESNVTYLDDAAALAEGKKIYDSNCMACHGAELQGTVGPNLTDAYWLHGGSVGDIFKTIRDGVPSKGMIPWKAQLSPEQIQQVSSYIISMEGSEPEGAKEPQGELFER